MKLTILTAAVCALLSSCSSLPVAASYTGAAAGHNFTVGYSGKEGIGIVISQK